MTKFVEIKLNKKGTTNSTELDNLGKKIFGKQWIGFFSADNVPTKNEFCEAKYSIINLDDSSQGGSHFIAVVCSKGVVYVYDSFGRKTSQLPMGNGQISPLPVFIKKAKMSNPSQDQKNSENNCGQRSFGFLLAFSQFGERALEI